MLLELDKNCNALSLVLVVTKKLYNFSLLNHKSLFLTSDSFLILKKQVTLIITQIINFFISTSMYIWLNFNKFSF